MKHSPVLLACLSVVTGCGGVANAATTGVLPAFVCAHPDALFAHGFETQATRYIEPSNGSGGAHPGEQTRAAFAAGYGIRNYYLYVPTSYSPSRPLPVMLVLHGAGGPGTAEAGAQGTRSWWSSIAEAGQFIVVAPWGSGQTAGSWVVPSDYEILRTALADARLAYNIDLSRQYLWGFSAGGHVAHHMILGSSSPGLNIDVFAGYAVNAGVLAALTCSNPPTAACTAMLANQPRRIPLDIHIGDSDPLLPYAQDDIARFQSAGWAAGDTFNPVTFVGGHTYTTEILGEIWDHLCPFQRLP